MKMKGTVLGLNYSHLRNENLAIWAASTGGKGLPPPPQVWESITKQQQQQQKTISKKPPLPECSNEIHFITAFRKNLNKDVSLKNTLRKSFTSKRTPSLPSSWQLVKTSIPRVGSCCCCFLKYNYSYRSLKIILRFRKMLIWANLTRLSF